VIKFVEKDWGPKPFKSINAWHLRKGFHGMVEEKWKSYLGQGNVINSLKEKFKLLKADLKLWNKEVFGNLNTVKKSILQDIENLDCQENQDIF